MCLDFSTSKKIIPLLEYFGWKASALNVRGEQFGVLKKADLEDRFLLQFSLKISKY